MQKNNFGHTGNREHNIEMVTDDDIEEDSSDDNDDHDHEQVSTSIVTSRSPPDTHPSKLNLILNLFSKKNIVPSS